MPKRPKKAAPEFPEPPPNPDLLAKIKAEVLDESGQIKPGKSLSSIRQAHNESKQAFVRRAYWQLLPKALIRVEGILDDPTASHKVVLSAAKEVVDRVAGKPVVQVETQIQDGDLFGTSTRELVERLQQLSSKLEVLADPEITTPDGKLIKSPHE